MKWLMLFFLLILFARPGLAQLKYEKESCIQRKEVPEKALSFVDSLPLDSKIRWYRETGYNKISYEAKTRYKGKRHSFEFSENGVFEDMEVQIKPEEIGSDASTMITQHLTGEFGKYSVEKIQIQYLGKPGHIQRFLRDHSAMDDITVHYEIVISAKVDGSFTLFEYLFSEDGDYIHRSRITSKITDNIEY